MINNKIFETLVKEKTKVIYYTKPNWKQKRQLYLCLPTNLKSWDEKNTVFYKVIDYKEGEELDLKQEKYEFAFSLALEMLDVPIMKDYGLEELL